MNGYAFTGWSRAHKVAALCAAITYGSQGIAWALNRWSQHVDDALAELPHR